MHGEEKDNTIREISNKNNTTKDPAQIAEVFNKYFEEIWEKLTESLKYN